MHKHRLYIYIYRGNNAPGESWHLPTKRENGNGDFSPIYKRTCGNSAFRGDIRQQWTSGVFTKSASAHFASLDADNMMKFIVFLVVRKYNCMFIVETR